MKTLVKLILWAGLASLLTACGQTGGLYLPSQQQQISG